MPTRVLMIEDDEDDYFLTNECVELIPDGDYVVDWESNGRTALEGSIAFDDYDVVLCDYQVGGVTRVEIVSAAVARGVDTPFILLTGHTDREIDFAAMQAGAVDHLVKDRVSPEVLEKAIRYSVKSAEARRALRRQSAVLKATMAATDIGMCADDASAGPPVWNARLAELLVGADAPDEAVIEAIRDLAARPELAAGQSIEISPHDGVGAIEVRLNNLEGGGYTLACYDVSKHKAIEEALRSARDEAERLSAAKSMFIARLSHEMRTPLHAVIGFGELLPTAAQQEIEEYAGIIVTSGRGLVTRIDQMLELSRMDLGKVRAALRQAPALAVLREAVNRAAKTEPGLETRVDIEVADNEVKVFGDHALLIKAIAELVSNASKYGAPGSTIRVGVDVGVTGETLLWVRNIAADGVEVPKEDPFVGFDQPEADLDRAREGLGIGLTYVRAVTKLIGGEARLQGEPDGRTVIASIRLPGEPASADAA